MPIPNLTYQGPLYINQGGTYSNLNIRSTDSNTPAILISTYDPVTITGCNIVSCGPCIQAYGGTKLTVHHNNLYGDTPNGGKQWGKAINDYHPQYLVFENNYIEHTGGILVDHSDENTKHVYIRKNILLNTDKRRADLSMGDQHAAGIQFNTVSMTECEVSWNKIVNIYGESRVEDCINIYNSRCPSTNPMKIHDNYIFGAYPWPNDTGFSGSGITVDGDPGTNTFDTVSAYINAYNNIVLQTCNAAMNIAAGHDVHYYDNIMISNAKYPDGQDSYDFWGACCIFNGSQVSSSVFTNNTIQGNTIAFRRPGINVPFTDRQDWVVATGGQATSWAVKAGDNNSLANPVTQQLIDDQLTLWNSRVAAAGIAIGNTTEVPSSSTTSSTTTTLAPVTTTTTTSTTTVPVTSTTTSTTTTTKAPTTSTTTSTTTTTQAGTPAMITIQKGMGVKATVVPLNASGTAALFTSGSIHITVSGNSFLKVEPNPSIPTEFTITALALGKSVIQVELKSISGKVITKRVDVQVVPNVDEAVSIQVIFTPIT